MTDAAAAAVGGQMVKSKMKSAAESCPSCASYPLKRSYFSAKFLATPPSSMQSISVAPGVKLADWPVHEMYDFLGTQRQWGQYLLRDDKLCRQIVAVFVTAYADVIGARRLCWRPRPLRPCCHHLSARSSPPVARAAQTPTRRCPSTRWTCCRTRASTGRSPSWARSTGSRRT